MSRQINNPVNFRDNIRSRLALMLDENLNIALNLERGVYNYCIGEADKRNIVKKWDNIYFKQVYNDRLRTIYTNIKEPYLKQLIIERKVRAHEVAYMTHQEMNPEKWEKLLRDKKIRDENRYITKIEASTDNYTCRKCKSKECSYYQLQTRSADEPMTTFVTCIPCGNRWKC